MTLKEKAVKSKELKVKGLLKKADVYYLYPTCFLV